MRRFFRPIPLAIAAVVLVGVYALVGFFLLPYVIKSRVIPSVSEQLGRPVLVQDVEINPFALSFTVTGFEIRENDQTALFGFERLYVNFESSSLIRRTFQFDEITLAVPFVAARIFPSGQLNLVELMKDAGGTASPPDGAAAEPQQEKKPLPPIEIGLLHIGSGIVEFRDESKRKPFEVSIVPIDIKLQNFTTRRGGESTYAFSAEVRKEELLNWEGYVSLDPLESEGKFSLTGVRGPVLWLYVKDRFNFEIPDGLLNISAHYRFDTTVEPFNLKLDDGEIGLTNLVLAESGKDEAVISIPSFQVHGITMDVAQQNLDISSIESKDALFKGWMEKDKTVNFQTLFVPKPPDATEAPRKDAAAAEARAEQRPWAVALKEIAFKNFGLDFEDRSTPTPAHHRITALNTTVKDLRVPFKDPITMDLGFQLNDTGSVHADGTIGLKPFESNIRLSLSAIPLKPLEPYVEGAARIAVDSGQLDLNGDLHLAVEHPNAPMLTYNGNFGIRNLSISDRDGISSLVSWKQLQLKQMALTVDPTTVAIEEVGLDQPAVQFRIQPDGQSNFSNIRPQAQSPEPAPEPASSPKTSPKKGPPPTVAVKTVKLLRGSATFVDESIKPAVRTSIHDLTGTIKGLSSKQLAKADVELTGRMDKVAPLKISGAINPLTENTFTDLLIKFENVDLTTAAPYSGKYAGYPISKGKLFLDLAYKVSKKQLEAENKVAIDQLTFGERTDSPDATSLPVPLAVALLKDRNGRIDIDLPIRGDLNDPDFKYGKVVISTLLNLLTKMVASPFALVGKLIPGGGSGEDLQYFEFAPGSAIASDEDVKKVDALVKALAERPGLRLEITGAADPVRDRQALGFRKLSAELLARWTRERGKSAAGESMPANEEQRLLKELYEQRRAGSASAGEPARSAAPPAVPPTIDEMRKELAAAMPFDEEDLRALARQRAEEIRTQLTAEGKLDGERVYLVNEDIEASDHERIRSKLGIAAS